MDEVEEEKTVWQRLYWLTRLKWQLPISVVLVIPVAYLLVVPRALWHIDVSDLTRSDFVTLVGALATVIAIFCSLSISFILFVSQQLRAERLHAYDQLKAQIQEAFAWLERTPESPDRWTCERALYYFDTLRLDELPRRNMQAHEDYAPYLERLEAVHQEDEPGEAFQFFRISARYFGRIEEAFSRIGVVSIGQIIRWIFLQTLAKGVALITISVVMLMVSAAWFTGPAKGWLLTLAAWVGVLACLLLLEVQIDLMRNYHDDVSFLDDAFEDESPEDEEERAAVESEQESQHTAG